MTRLWSTHGTGSHWSWGINWSLTRWRASRRPHWSVHWWPSWGWWSNWLHWTKIHVSHLIVQLRRHRWPTWSWWTHVRTWWTHWSWGLLPAWLWWRLHHVKLFSSLQKLSCFTINEALMCQVARLYEAVVCVTSIRVTFSSTSAQDTSTNQKLCLFVSTNRRQLF